VAAPFYGDPEITGKPITLNGEPYTVIGVMPAGFDFPGPTVETLSSNQLNCVRRRSVY